MKKDKNNEIDLLLRSLGRDERGDTLLDPGKGARREGAELSEHLDADELNAFAEGVLPDAARTRYVAHLADCDKCRGFVSTLAQSSGVTAIPETPERRPGPSFWQKIAVLFSPPVLRYAVPVMALTAVIAISFIAMRQPNRDQRALVAMNGPAAVATPAADNRDQVAATNRDQVAPTVAPSGTGAPAKTRGVVNSPAEVDSSRDRKTLDDKTVVTQAPPLTSSDTNTSNFSLTKDSDRPKQSYGVAGSRPVFAPEPAPPPPAKVGVDSAEKNTALKKEDLARREAQELPREEEKNQPRDEAGRHGPSRNNAILPGSKRADGLMSERAENKAKDKEDSDDRNEVETRTVSGKRFRRQGNAWVDTAYDSSRSTINVTRGSERFRVLVADEPGIRSIAEKLNGVVIVVWNEKAYRIQ